VAFALCISLFIQPSGQQCRFLLVLRSLGVAVVLFIPTFLMGGTLPILVRGLTREDELGARISRLYWVNTLVAVLARFSPVFVLLPSLGLRLTITSAAVSTLWPASSPSDCLPLHPCRGFPFGTGSAAGAVC